MVVRGAVAAFASLWDDPTKRPPPVVVDSEPNAPLFFDPSAPRLSTLEPDVTPACGTVALETLCPAAVSPDVGAAATPPASGGGTIAFAADAGGAESSAFCDDAPVFVPPAR